MSGNTNYGSGTTNSNGTNNTSLGIDVLSNTESSTTNNSGVGAYSLANNTTGISNVAVGSNSLLTNTTGNYNTGLGTAALVFNSTGSSNVSVGSNSLEYNTTGSSNVGLGTQTLYNNTTGGDNTSIGTYSQYTNTSGSYNVSLGSDTLYTNTASNNTAVGYGAMYLNTTGTENVAVGTDSLNGNTAGSYNSALGVIAGSSNTTGNYNTFLGYNSGSSGSTGYYSTAIGYNSRFTGNNQIVLGTTSEIVIVPGVFQLGRTSGNVTTGVTGAVYYNPINQSLYTSNGVNWIPQYGVKGVTGIYEPNALVAEPGYSCGVTLTNRPNGGYDIQLAAATVSTPGIVTTGLQIFEGDKRFSGGISYTNIQNGDLDVMNFLNLLPKSSGDIVSFPTPTIYYNSNPLLTGAAALYIKGTLGGYPAFDVAVKSFIIDHPTDNEKYLVHGCLEGPEAGVYYRGTDKITNGESVVVKLPSYVEKLANNFTVHVTPIYNGKIVACNASRVEKGQFLVYGPNCEFDWVVYASRGAIGVEPYKKDVVVKGDGPYKYTA